MPRIPSQLTYNDLNGAEARDVLTDWFAQLLTSHPQFASHLTFPKAKFSLDIHVKIEMYTGGTVPVASAPDVLAIDGVVTLVNDLSAQVNVSPTPGGRPPDMVREAHGLPIPTPGYGPRDIGGHLFLADLPVATEDVRGQGLREQTKRDSDSSVGVSTGGRSGDVAEGYVFSTEAVTTAPQEQHIPVTADGGIDIDLTGRGRMFQGDMIVTAGSHVSSAKTFGDQRGSKYGSVAGTYDAGPAGLGRGRGGGLGADGRPRITFGNQR